MTYLSQALKAFYKRKYKVEGMRIIFKRGDEFLTQSKVASEIRSKLLKDGKISKFDESFLSKVLKGKRLFTFEQLHTFCRILDLNDEQENSLRIRLSYDLGTKEEYTKEFNELEETFTQKAVTVRKSIYLSVPLFAGTRDNVQWKKNIAFYQKVKDVLEKKANKTVYTRTKFQTLLTKKRMLKIKKGMLDDALKTIPQCQYFLLLLPNISSTDIGSHLIELGVAFAHNIPILVYTHKSNYLPVFLKEKNSQVTIIEYYDNQRMKLLKRLGNIDADLKNVSN